MMLLSLGFGPGSQGGSVKEIELLSEDRLGSL